ncbi:HAD hydrolase-like protein [Streptomyces sp. NPDC005538]|uniref:HAD hydrolase-like protein n=1 Tax=Streptomyces sp. NPDC005538 TaxID=3157043 RepID=UPI0033AD40B6
MAHYPSWRLGCAKPDPRAVQTVVRLHDVHPSQLLHVGDSLDHGVRGALAAGAWGGMGAVDNPAHPGLKREGCSGNTTGDSRSCRTCQPPSCTSSKPPPHPKQHPGAPQDERVRDHRALLRGLPAGHPGRSRRPAHRDGGR